MNQSDIDRAAEKVGGRFRLSVLLQKRVRELVRGATPMVTVEGKPNPQDIALLEILEADLKFTETGDLEEADILGLREKKEKE